MRKKHKKNPKVGDYRTNSGFLLFPKRIGDETRWLEYAKWQEKIVEDIDVDMAGTAYRILSWEATDWLTE